MIVIWLDGVKFRNLEIFFSIIENWEALELILEKDGIYYHCFVNLEKAKEKGYNIAESIKIEDKIIETLRKEANRDVFCFEIKAKNKKELIEKFSETNAILLLRK